MKKCLLMFLTAALLAGCESKTDFGDCIGVQDDELPTLKYKVSVQNLVIGALFIETLAVPVYTVLTGAKCPVGPKTEAKP